MTPVLWQASLGATDSIVVGGEELDNLRWNMLWHTAGVKWRVKIWDCRVFHIFPSLWKPSNVRPLGIPKWESCFHSWNYFSECECPRISQNLISKTAVFKWEGAILLSLLAICQPGITVIPQSVDMVQPRATFSATSFATALQSKNPGWRSTRWCPIVS